MYQRVVFRKSGKAKRGRGVYRGPALRILRDEDHFRPLRLVHLTGTKDLPTTHLSTLLLLHPQIPATMGSRYRTIITVQQARIFMVILSLILNFQLILNHSILVTVGSDFPASVQSWVSTVQLLLALPTVRVLQHQAAHQAVRVAQTRTEALSLLVSLTLLLPRLLHLVSAARHRYSSPLARAPLGLRVSVLIHPFPVHRAQHHLPRFRLHWHSQTAPAAGQAHSPVSTVPQKAIT